MNKQIVDKIESVLSLLDMKIFFMPNVISVDLRDFDSTCPYELIVFMDQYYKALNLSTYLPEHVIIHVKTAICTEHLLIPWEEEQTFLLIGPFLPRYFAMADIELVLLHHELKPTDAVRYYYNSLPVLEPKKLDVLVKLLADCMQGEEPASFLTFRQGSMATTNEVFVTNEDERPGGDIFRNKRNLEDLIYADVCAGQIGDCEKHWAQYLQLEKHVYSEQHNLKAAKEAATIENALYRRGAERNDVSPHIAEALYIDNNNRIMNATNTTELNEIRERMVKGYCLIVKEHSLTKYSQLIRTAISYVRIYLDKPLKLSEVAATCGVSSTYLSQAFSKEVGINLNDYIAINRIERARLLLRNSMVPVAVIAYQVGYEDNNYFSRVFKKYVGMTPTQYRNDPTSIQDIWKWRI